MPLDLQPAWNEPSLLGDLQESRSREIASGIERARHRVDGSQPSCRVKGQAADELIETMKPGSGASFAHSLHYDERASANPSRLFEQGDRIAGIVQNINEGNCIKLRVPKRQCTSVEQRRPRPDHSEVDDIHLRHRTEPQATKALGVMPGPAADIQYGCAPPEEWNDAGHQTSGSPEHQGVHHPQCRIARERCPDSRCVRCGGGRPRHI